MQPSTIDTAKNPAISVTMFGLFSIAGDNTVIRDSDTRTHQLWHLIEYLIAFRNKPVTQAELIKALWPAGNIDNPANALKNLVYRIRSTFGKANLPYAKELIAYNRGSYHWNNSLPCVVDTELFELYLNQAENKSLSDNDRIERYLKAIDLFTGDFLPGSRYESWVVPLAARYRSLYFKGVYALLELLANQGRYEESEAICRRALKIDPFEEPAHIHMMKSMIQQGKQSQALTHYSYVTDLFFREMGISSSEAMRALHRDIMKRVHDVEVDISTIQGDLKENSESEGAFYCEYEVFKNLYRLEARTAARTGQSIFICLLSVKSEKSDEDADLKPIAKAMDQLFDIVQGSLRKGDVFARFSASQYVLMLPTLTYENCQMVMTRVIRRYRQAHRNRDISVHAKMQPLEPVGAIR